MLSFLSRPRKSDKELKREFLKKFYLHDSHSWILGDRYVKANFDEFFDRISWQILKRFSKKRNLIFLPSNGKYSCTLSSINQHIIMVFPELMRLLKSPATNHALAILAHEIGHIVSEHSKKAIDPLEAQVEADLFACKMGYAVEIESFLHNQIESIEKRLRLTYVTAYIVSTSHKSKQAA
jgi:hypothetical protein